MTDEERDIVYKGIGDYKGYRAWELGCGLLIMIKGGKEIKAQRGLEVANDKWVEECWQEVKAKIDAIELA
jgi:hypothetical protein